MAENNPRILPDANLLRRQAAVAALDEVLLALETAWAMLEQRPDLIPLERGLDVTSEAAKKASEYLEGVGLIEDANLLRVEADRYYKVFYITLFTSMAMETSEEKFEHLRSLAQPLHDSNPLRLGHFPTNQAEIETSVELNRELCQIESDSLCRHVRRIQSLLTSGSATGIALGSEKQTRSSDVDSPTPALGRRSFQQSMNVEEANKEAMDLANADTPVRPKKSTQKGEGRVKLIAALTKHHEYADGSCLNPEPIGNNELARQAGVDKKTASEFFKKEFKGHDKYNALCRNDTQGLITALKLLNDEFSPYLLYGAKPPGEDEDFGKE